MDDCYSPGILSSQGSRESQEKATVAASYIKSNLFLSLSFLPAPHKGRSKALKEKGSRRRIQMYRFALSPYLLTTPAWGDEIELEFEVLYWT